MDVVGVVAGVALLLVPSVKKLLDSVAYRNRARGKAEVIYAQRAVEVSRQVPSGGRRQVEQEKRKQPKQGTGTTSG
ncbi:hypothetical protein [Streptomyces violascens]|uniref:Secreted protein n=1 Tax=Streptomyces violascens TaxID=67381 RepID=A0ABQ3QL26_9ACTN|nr:hypothetical protein [Streptomyces violascens]GGU44853.1 hypothetical protein GCM10010289_76840 [Streptomyces violascens]GHI37987.1 hypothetical protein Sviol_23950 [Streptomyces violascens]